MGRLTENVSGYRALAAAVIRQALDDARSRSGLTERETAIAFLTGAEGSSLSFWCDVAGLEFTSLQRRLAGLLAPLLAEAPRRRPKEKRETPLILLGEPPNCDTLVAKGVYGDSDPLQRASAEGPDRRDAPALRA